MHKGEAGTKEIGIMRKRPRTEDESPCNGLDELDSIVSESNGTPSNNSIANELQHEVEERE